MSNNARPPAMEPVNDAALISGARSAATPASVPKMRPRTPVGAPAAARACWTWAAVAAESSGWPGWALTTTGHPAARAEAVSPPATLKANGKLLAAKTKTGPSGCRIRRRSGRGAPIGQSGSAWSIRTSR